MGNASDRVLQLRSVTFTYKADPTHELQFGLIAEEVHEVFPELVLYNAQGEPESVRYHDLSVLLLNELQRKNKTLEDLLDRVAMLEKKVP
jgi:hypothetical protein